MEATARTYGTAGLALVSAGVIGIAPIAPLSPAFNAASNAASVANPANAAVRLANSASDALSASLDYFDWSSLANPATWQNIVQNLFIDIVNMPYNWWQGVNTYATAGLGFPGVVGVDEIPTVYDPQHPNPVLTGTQGDPAEHPVYAPVGPMDGTDVDGNPVHGYVPIGIGGTGSWWMESSGNTWGWDEGNFGQVLGLSNMIVPIPQFSTPFAYSLQAFAMQQIVANPDACPFECHDILGYLGRWLNVPLGNSFEGVEVGKNFGADFGGGTALDPQGSDIDPLGIPISWAGDTVQYDPFFFITSFLKSLAMDPDASGNAIADYGQWLADPEAFFAPFIQDLQDILYDFNPFVDGSFLYWGAPGMYTVPALTGGLISSFTGIANPMAAYTLAPGGALALEPYAGEPAVDGANDNGSLQPEGIPDLTNGPVHLVTAGDLPAGLGAGLLNWAGGLLGYLEPDTYLHALGLTVADLPDKLGPDFDWLTDGLTGWQDSIGGVISQLAGVSNDLIPWYTDLTDGMEALLPS